MIDVLSGAITNNPGNGFIYFIGFAVLVLLPGASFVMILLGRGNKRLRHSVLRLVGLILVAAFLYTLVIGQFASQIHDISIRHGDLSSQVSGEAGPGLWLFFFGQLVVFICSIGAKADVEITKAKTDIQAISK
jgi:hypothetical protein